MNNTEKRTKLLYILFGATILVSSGFLMVNVFDYIGLLNSMKMVNVSLDEIVLSPGDDKIKINLTILIQNPTRYRRLKFSSLQCQIFHVTNNNEEYIGVTAYAPPTDIPLKPHIETSYPSVLSIVKPQSGELSEEPLAPEMNWRIRCVVHFSTPIKKYYQTYIFYQTSSISTG